MRERALSAACSVFFILLWAGLFYTQVLRFGYYSRLSRDNSIRIIPIDAPRGNILDRNGVPLVTNRLSFDAALIYEEIKDRRGLIRLLSGVLKMPGGAITDALDAARKKPYAPVVIAEDINKERAIMLEEAGCDVDGLLIETKSRRDYLYGSVGSHCFGYLSRISESELEGLKGYGYRAEDMIGRDGIEKFYNTHLDGLNGGIQVEVDNVGRQIRVIGLKEPVPGKDLYLTLDIRLQLACDKLLGEHKGAVIVMDPRNGEVLALASHPAFDPNIFVRPNTSVERVRLLQDQTGRPIFDRAISGLYPPGSIFKIVTAASALETNRVKPDTRFFCNGSYRLGSAKFDCWKEEGHGSQNIRGGLAYSCNVFFYNAGRSAGVDNIETFAKLFGFGRPAGIDLPGEAKGVVPGRIWKRLFRKSGWYEGDTLNYAIGQGYLLVTPIQVLGMTAAMANRGSLVRPFILKRVESGRPTEIKPRKIGLKNSTVQEVREGLFQVVSREDGTGKRARSDGIAAAGKTGTAQNPHGKTHAWFSGFAPYGDPKICLVVFLEHGGKGGLESAEIARDIFEEAKTAGYL